jgi:hypothetical protein
MTTLLLCSFSRLYLIVLQAFAKLSVSLIYVKLQNEDFFYPWRLNLHLWHIKWLMKLLTLVLLWSVTFRITLPFGQFCYLKLTCICLNHVSVAVSMKCISVLDLALQGGIVLLTCKSSKIKDTRLSQDCVPVLLIVTSST